MAGRRLAQTIALGSIALASTGVLAAPGAGPPAFRGRAARVFQRLRGKPRPAAVAHPAAPRERLTETPHVVDKRGHLRPLAFDPAHPPQNASLMSRLRGLPGTMRDFKRYRARVDALIGGITDAELEWSLGRLETMETRPGTALSQNDMVNKWGRLPVAEIGPADHRGSTLDDHERAILFDNAMNLEDPTNRYQWVSAHQWANSLPKAARFMGISMPDRVVAVALNGGVAASARAVWNAEEARHSNILERVYNASRPDERPPITARGAGTHQPKVGARAARIQTGRRQLGEIGAATGYTVMKANAVEGSPTDQALEGIFKDEIYHYVIMGAVAKAGYGQDNRFRRVLGIATAKFERSPKKAIDWLIHEKKGLPPKILAEAGYAFNAIDKRIDRFLRQQSPERLERLVGRVYRTDRQVADALAAGEIADTPAFRHEQNPDLGQEELGELVRRFPGVYDPSTRVLRASQIDTILTDFRRVYVPKPEYWESIKGAPAFTRRAGGAGAPPQLTRALAEPGARLELSFAPAAGRPGRGAGRASGAPVRRAAPTARIVRDGATAFEASLDGLSMRQIGALMTAADLSVLEQLRAAPADLSHAEIVANLSPREQYKKFPLAFVDDRPAAK